MRMINLQFIESYSENSLSLIMAIFRFLIFYFHFISFEYQVLKFDYLILLHFHLIKAFLIIELGALFLEIMTKFLFSWNKYIYLQILGNKLSNKLNIKYRILNKISFSILNWVLYESI